MRALLGVAAACLLAGAAHAQTTLTPKRAADFVNSIGANTHLGYGSGSYSPPHGIDLVHQAITYLWPSGAKVNLRESLPNYNFPISTYASLHTNYNVNFDVVSTSNPLNPSGDITSLESLAVSAPGAVVAYEGPNEFNINHDTSSNIQGGADSFNNPSWGTAANTYYYNQLQSAISAHSNLAGLNYIGVTTADGQNPTQNGNNVLSQMGDQSAHENVASTHIYFYPNGIQPRPNYVTGYNTAHGSNTNAPVYATETGYNTAYGYAPNAGFSGGGNNANYTKLMLNIVGDAVDLGLSRIYYYELLQDQPGTPSSADDEGNFGMFSVASDSSSVTPKPAAVALHNLFYILWDSSANNTTFSTTSITYTATNLPSGSHAVSFQKSNGDIYLMFWAEPVIWNDNNHTSITAPTNTVTVTFPQAHNTLATYDPVIGTSSLATAMNATSINVAVSDHPVLVLVSSNGSTPVLSVCRAH